jgi:hypothetical protein
MKKYFAIIISIFAFNSSMLSQSFEFKGNDLYGMQHYINDSTQRAIKLMFNDIDFDGDQDLIVAGINELKYDSSGNIKNFAQINYFISLQENIGTRWNPSFAPRKPFIENFPFQNGYFFPAAGDLNNDKKLDLFVASAVDSSLNLVPLYFQRKSLTGNDQFNIIKSETIGLHSLISGSFFSPELADFDKDGDLDILMSGFFPSLDTINTDRVPVFLFAKNSGTKDNPSFKGWYQNPYGLANTIDEVQIATVGDLDNDNDNDIISLTTIDTFTIINYYENTPLPDGKANFTSFSSLLGLPVANSEESILFPSLVDIDGDGDLDLFMSQDLLDKGSGIGFYENLICTETLDNTISQSGNILKANLNGLKYQWYDCTIGADIVGASAQTYQPPKSGKYAVKLENNSGCENISVCYNFVLSATADQILSNQITIYPNPTDDYFTIENSSQYSLSGVIIRNNIGQVIKILKPNLTEKIETADLPDGIYSLEITLGQWKVQKNLVIIDSGK